MQSVVHDAEDSCLKNHGKGLGPATSTQKTSTGVDKTVSGTSLSGHLDPEKGNSYDKDSDGTLASENGTLSTERGVADDNDKNEDDYPEGGLLAWLVVLGSMCSLFMVFGLANSSGAFQEIFASDLLKSHSPEQIGWIFSLNLFCTFFGGIYVGIWFDTHGPRFLVFFGSIFTIVGTMLLGVCTEYWQFLLDYGVLIGLGGALLMSPGYGCICHFFNRRRGLTTGIATTAGSIGGIILPQMLNSLVPKIGFAWATRCIGFMFIALAIPANLFARKRLPPAVVKVRIIPDLSPFKSLQFALTALGVFFLEWGLFVPLAYITSYCTDQGLSVSFGLTMLTLVNVGSMFGRVIPGILSDKFGRFNVILVTMSFCAIFPLALWLPAGSSKALIIVFALLWGFASGSNLGLIPVCVSQLCDTQEYGRHLAALFFLAGFGTLTSVPIGGSIISATGGAYWGLIIFDGLAYAVAVACFVYPRGSLAGWKLSAKF